jgi:hypothetical protein
MSSLEKLSNKDKIEIIVEAGLNAIPMIGGSLATLYFSTKQEKRFKRVEKFYELLKTDFDRFKEKIENIDNLNKEEVVGIIEEINERVESDYTEEKLKYFKNCFYNTLTDSIDDGYGKRKYFINVLGQLTPLDIEVITNLFKVDDGHGYLPDPNDKEGNNPEFVGSLEKLKSIGIVYSKLNGTLRPGINWAEITLYTISDFGKEFARFCLENVIDKINSQDKNIPPKL